MEVKPVKASILKRIKDVLFNKTPKKTSKTPKTSQPDNEVELKEALDVQSTESLSLTFAEAFNKVSGKFIYCESIEEFVDQLNSLTENNNWNNLHCWHPQLQEVFQEVDFRKCRIGKNLDKADGGITTCEALVARTGSILLSSALPSGRTLSIFPPVHICVAYTSQLVYDIDDALQMMLKRYDQNLPSFVSLSTGPSRTANTEESLALGENGPKDVYVFLIEQPVEEID